MRLVMQSVCFQFRVGFKRWTKPFAPWQYLAWAVSSFSLRLWIVNPCKSNIDHYNSHIHPGVSQLFPTFIRVSIVRFCSNLRRSNNKSHVFQGGVSMAIRIRSAWDPQQIRQGRQVAVRQTRQIFSVETSPHRFPQSVTDTVDMMCTNPQIGVRKGYITRHCCLLAAMLILDHLSSVTSGTANVGKHIPRRCLHGSLKLLSWSHDEQKSTYCSCPFCSGETHDRWHFGSFPKTGVWLFLGVKAHANQDLLESDLFNGQLKSRS